MTKDDASANTEELQIETLSGDVRDALLMVDSDTFFGEREPAHVDPDQPDLPGEDETEAA